MITRIKKDNNYIVIISSYDIDKLRCLLSCKNLNKLLKHSIDNLNIENYVCKLLHSLGIPSNMKGYKYINDIIMHLYNNDIDCRMCEMYTYISNKYKTKRSNVERNICNAIEACFSRGDIEVIDSIFGYSTDSNKGNPTNKEFICTLYDKLSLDYRKY